MMKRARIVMLSLATAVYVSMAFARDVETEQHNASAALDTMQSAKSQYEADMAQVAQYKQRVADIQKQLDAMEKRAAESKARYLEAKADYDKKQAALERAWKK